MPFNLVYADTSGDVGWQLVGDAPQRRKGWGMVPLPGSDPDAGWKDAPVPFDEMPHVSGPDAGLVATANNQPTPAGGGPFLGVDWLDGYRHARIVEALQDRRDWDIASVLALQMDQVSIPWRELRDTVLSAPAETAEAQMALTLLQDWDGVVATGSPAATVFEFFVAEMIQRVVGAKAPRSAEWSIGVGFTPLTAHSAFAMRRVGHLVRLLQEQPERWFRGSWPEEVADALTSVIRSLRKDYGDDPRRWAWGRVRPLTLRHPVGERKPLDRVFNLGPFPWGGDTNTVGQGGTVPLDPTANPSWVASLRMVVDVGNWEESRFVLPGGQSGNPCSPHYDDLLGLWQLGEGVPIAWSSDEVDRRAVTVLHLVSTRQSD